MSAGAFVDANVFVYLVDRDEPDKRATARRILDTEDELITSAQVLGEFYVASTRRIERPITEQLAASMVARFSRLRVVLLSAGLVESAIAISRQAQLSYWDGLVLAAASAAGCENLLTEDLNHGQVIAGVRVENPFG